MSNKVLKINPKDNVIVALQDLKSGENIEFEGNSYILPSNSMLSPLFKSCKATITLSFGLIFKTFLLIKSILFTTFCF